MHPKITIYATMKIKVIFALLMIISIPIEMSGFVPSGIVYKHGLDSLLLYGTQQEILDVMYTLNDEDPEEAILAAELASSVGSYSTAWESNSQVWKELQNDTSNRAKLLSLMAVLNSLRMYLEGYVNSEYISKIDKGLVEREIIDLRKAGLIDRYIMYDYFANYSRFGLYADTFDMLSEFMDKFEKFVDENFDKMSPHRSEFLSLKGQYHHAIGNQKIAYECFKESVNLYASHPEREKDLTLAECYTHAASYLMYYGDYDQGFRLVASGAKIVLDKGRIHHSLFQSVSKVIAAYHAYKGDFDIALKAIDEALGAGYIFHSKTGLPGDMYATRMIINWQKKDIDAAMKDFQLAMNLYMGKIWGNMRGWAAIGELYSRALLELKHYDDAEETLLSSLPLLDLMPSFPKRGTYWDLSLCYLGKGENAKAAEWFNKIIDDTRKEIKNTFPYFPEKSRNVFWKTEASYLKAALASAPENAEEIGKTLFNASLLVKGLLLRTSSALEEASKKVDDSGEALETQLDKLREMKYLSLMYPENKSLADKVSQMEYAFLHSQNLIPADMSFVDNTWEEIKRNLKPGEVVVEFVNSGNEFGNFYGAEVLSYNSNYPVHVPLFDNEHFDNELPSIWSGKLAKYLKNATTVYFVPSGDLHNYPLEHFNYQGNKLMSDIFSMVRLSSSMELLRRKDFNERLDVKNGIIVYGGLNYNLGMEEMELQALIANDRGGTSWGYLPGTLTEATAIKSVTGERTRLFSGDEGIEETFKALSKKSPEVIHIATHGYYKPGESLQESGGDEALTRCGLVMTGGNNFWNNDNESPDGIEDGLLTGAEVAALDLKGTNLVALSACNTGLGDVAQEGVFGLQRAFKIAGVKSLLMTLREVNGEATSILMSEFYSRIAAGVGKRDALSMAQKKLRSSKITVNGKQVSGNNPEYWTPFILVD